MPYKTVEEIDAQIRELTASRARQIEVIQDPAQKKARSAWREILIGRVLAAEGLDQGLLPELRQEAQRAGAGIDSVFDTVILQDDKWVLKDGKWLPPPRE